MNIFLTNNHHKMGCIIKCCSDNILNIFVFLKPTPASYDIEKISIIEDKLKSNENSNSSLIERKNKSSSFKTEKEVLFNSKTNTNEININNKDLGYKEIDLILKNKIHEGSVIQLIKRNYPFLEVKCYNLKVDEGSFIIVIEIINKKNKKNDLCSNLLFSHGNSTDLGLSFNTLVDFSYQLQCNIYSFDYRGYGKSLGVTNESNIYKDFETVINFITTIKPNKVSLESLVL